MQILSVYIAEERCIVWLSYGLFIRSSVDIQWVPLFSYLWTMALWTLHVQIFVWIYVFLDRYVGGELLGHKWSLNFISCQTLFRVVVQFTFPSEMYEDANFFMPSSTFTIVLIAILVIVYLILVLVCISQMINDVKHLFRCLLALCAFLYSLVKCLFKFIFFLGLP